MLAFVCRDMGDRCKDVRTMRRRPLNAVPMIDAALSRLVVDIEVLQVVVEVD